jgi:hypothetical protein
MVLANASGLVGKNLMDTVGAGLGGQIPLLENLPLHNEDGAGGDHVYAPWWLYKEQHAGKLDFPRGYHIEFASGDACRDSASHRDSSSSPVAATARRSRPMRAATMDHDSASPAAAR